MPRWPSVSFSSLPPTTSGKRRKPEASKGRCLFLAAAEAQALFRQRQEGEQLRLLGRFFLGAAVGHELRKLRHLRAPPAVRTLLVDDGEVHARVGWPADQRGAVAPPCPATDSFQMIASSTA